MNEEQRQASESARDLGEARKPYRRPSLTVLGRIEEVTQGLGANNTDFTQTGSQNP